MSSAPRRPPGPAQPARPPPASGPNWPVLIGLCVGGLALVAVVGWLVFGGGANAVLRALPEGVVKVFGERPGEGKRVEQKLSDYPGEKTSDPGPGSGTAADKAGPSGAPDRTPSADAPANVDPAAKGDDGATAAEEQAEALKPLQAQAKVTDAAIDKVRESKGANLDDLRAAEAAVEALRGFSLKAVPSRYRKAAEAERKALTDERSQGLEAAQRLAKATHLVFLPKGMPRDTVVLRQAASASSENVAILDDGTLLKVHLDTGKGWVRVDALSGPATGKAGYLQARFVKKIDR